MSVVLILSVSIVSTLALAQSTQSPRFEPSTAQNDQVRIRKARLMRNDDIHRLFAKSNLDYPPDQIVLRVFKDEDALELWARAHGQKEFVFLKQYAICARSGGLGPKRIRGDLQVPEGFYEVTAFRPQSIFHLALRINYPNASDRIRGNRENPGGDILIHGACCTVGCIPLTDRWIEELYLICLDTFSAKNTKIQVHIFPRHLDEKGMQILRQEYKDRLDELLFWEELKIGFDFFDKTRALPEVQVNRDGSYRFNGANDK